MMPDGDSMMPERESIANIAILRRECETWTLTFTPVSALDGRFQLSTCFWV